MSRYYNSNDNNNNNNNNNNKKPTKKELVNNFIDESPKKTIFIGLLVAGTVAYAATRYKTSKSSEYLVRTGLGINDTQIGKKFVKWPFQNIETLNISPYSYRFHINAMSKEKLEIDLPTVFTIGPNDNDESRLKYVKTLLNKDEEELRTIILDSIQGDTRTLATQLSIEEIFYGRKEFTDKLMDIIQTKLDQYGLKIYNANIEELKDSQTSTYFKSMSQKIKAIAENKAKIDISEQVKLGEIGAKEREGETRQRTLIIESETTMIENSRRQEIAKSDADLEKTRIEQNLIVQQANIKATNEALLIKTEMEKQVEAKRAEMELEKKRASDLTMTQVNAEMEAKRAEGEANSKKIAVDALFYTTSKEAEARLIADKLKADALLYSNQKEAEGITAIYKAKADGLQKMVDAFGGNANALMSFKMLENGVYEKLAESNAKAIQGLNPKITVWTNDGKNSMDSIQNLSKSVIPMLSTIEDQTGYKLADWLITNKKNNKPITPIIPTSF